MIHAKEEHEFYKPTALFYCSFDKIVHKGNLGLQLISYFPKTANISKTERSISNVILNNLMAAFQSSCYMRDYEQPNAFQCVYKEYIFYLIHCTYVVYVCGHEYG